jgi:hypothetical protein
LVLPLAGFEPLVPSCLWLKFQKQVRRLQLGSLTVHQSFQPSAEAFLVGVPLEGEYISAAPLFKNYK